jgi:3-carboxy-cis,cis-muconate cycloisomerase
MSVSPFDHPILSALFGEEVVAAEFTFEAELAAMLRFETALAEAEASEGVISKEAATAIAEALQDFPIGFNALRAGAERDGVVVPELVRGMRARIGEPYGQYVHFGATSQDVSDTALVLRLQSALEAIETRLDRVAGQLGDLEKRFGDNKLTLWTRMQTALPGTVADRLNNWHAPLTRHLQRIGEIKPRLLVLQFGGPVGTLDTLGDKGPAVAKRLAEALGLGLPDTARHTERDGLAEFGGWLSLVTGALGKMGQDIALMAQTGIGTVELSGGGGSSSMPHKQNPVDAEVLVTLARFNATQLSGMHQALVHENERSGAAWSLEWLILPQMVVATAGALRRAAALLDKIERIGDA